MSEIIKSKLTAPSSGLLNISSGVSRGSNCIYSESGGFG